MSAKTEHRSVFQRETDIARASFSNVELKMHGVLPNAMREYYMLGLRPKPYWGFHPQAPERGSPRRRTVKFGCNTIEQLSEI